MIRLLAGRTGGAERVFCALANALAQQGYVVSAVYCEGRKDPPAFPLNATIRLTNLWDPKERARPRYRRFKRWSERPLPFGLHHLFAWFVKYLPFVLSLRRLVRETKPALVISFLPSANTPGLLACLGTSTKILCTNHGVPHSDYESTERWDQNPLDRYLRRKLLFRANGLTVLFPAYASYFSATLRPRVHAITNFLDSTFFEQIPATERVKRIVASGRLSWEKNYETLILAFDLLSERAKDYTLVIYGDGPERDKLIRLIEQRGLEDRIQLPGHDARIVDRLREAQIFCHPAHFEGFGLSAAEALAQGLPVVIYGDCSGVNEYVIDGENGLLVERTAGAAGLANALLRLIEDEPLRERLSRSAPKTVEAFRSEVVLADWRRVIDTICNS